MQRFDGSDKWKAAERAGVCPEAVIGRRAMLASVAAAGAAAMMGGCQSPSGDGKGEVVVFAALDREFSEPVLNDFQRESGVRVSAKYDVESTKTVGLVTLIRQQKSRPQCDVFWNNEILHTLRLKREGLLESYSSPAGEPFPAWARDRDGAWHGFAGRARVLLVNTRLLPEADAWPVSVDDLASERWRGKCGLAKPLFGTTASHAALLFSQRGDEAGREFFRAVRRNAEVLSGNKQVAVAVGRGQLSFGLTDTDDALAELNAGSPVRIVFPDQGEGRPGSVLIPNTTAIIKGCRHEDAARRLVDHLLSASVERSLAESSSGQYPLNPKVVTESQVPTPSDVRWMEVDWQAAADNWESSSEFLREEFAR